MPPAAQQYFCTKEGITPPMRSQRRLQAPDKNIFKTFQDFHCEIKKIIITFDLEIRHSNIMDQQRTLKLLETSGPGKIADAFYVRHSKAPHASDVIGGFSLDSPPPHSVTDRLSRISPSYSSGKYDFNPYPVRMTAKSHSSFRHVCMSHIDGRIDAPDTDRIPLPCRRLRSRAPRQRVRQTTVPNSI